MTRAVSLISSGIDSPVAAYLMLKKGFDMVCVNFDSYPDKIGGSKEKVIKQVKSLSKKFNKDIKLYIIDHKHNYQTFGKGTNPRYTCIFCKRVMLKISEKIAEIEDAKYLITGENLGQVASQTLDNMSVIDSIVDIPVLRPVLTYDKQEIINLAQAIGTYETSVQKELCCPMLPINPITKSRKYKVEYEEAKFDMDKLADEAINGAKVLTISA